ncbi:MAG: hypothetical protein KDC83_11220, partial [Flavobacteriales bacterium]|nr:hypothetical protein [Flavobacteriales bacterium]
TQQLSNSATQQLSNSATQQLSNSATQQLKNALSQQLIWKLGIAFVLFNLHYLTITAQIGGLSYQSGNDQLRGLFSQLQKPTNPDAALLYDMAGHFSDNKWWSSNCPDTNNASNWSLLYEEAWYAQYDTTILPRIWTYYKNTQKHHKDTVTFGLIDYEFHKIDDDALTTDKYFLIDNNDALVDNFKFKYLGGPTDDTSDANLYGIDYSYEPNPIYQNADSSSPYTYGEIFAANIFREEVYFRNVTFKIDPAFLFISPIQLATYLPEFSLRIDFGDGKGWQIIDHQSVSYLSVDYPSSGNYIIKAAYFDNMGNASRGSTTEIVVISNEQKINPSETWNLPGIQAGVYRACYDPNDPDFREKFIIYVEGIDPTNELDVSYLYSKRIMDNNLVTLRNHGYTFVVVNWINSTDDLTTNSSHLRGLINHIKCNEITTDEAEQFIVIGESMGGVIARHALRWMETQAPLSSECIPNLQHNTRLFISFDAPQNGAYVPLAGQHAVSGLVVRGAMWAYREFRKAQQNADFLFSPAAKQLLNLHVGAYYVPNQIINSTTLIGFKQNSSIYNAMAYLPHADHTSFQAFLHSMGNHGFPAYCKNVGISNGLLTGNKQIRETDFLGMPVPPVIINDGDLYFEANASLDVVFFNSYFNFLTADLETRTIDPSGSIPVYRHNFGMKFPQIKIKKKYIVKPFKIKIAGVTFWKSRGVWIPDGLELVDKYIISVGREEHALLTYPWDNTSGSFYYIGGIINTINSLLPLGNFDWGLNANNFTFAGFYGQSSTSSQADRFCFIPTVSALDYDYNNGNFDPLQNILAQSTTSKMSKTPFDVIMGRNVHPNYPDPNLIYSEPYSWHGAHVRNIQNYRLHPNSTLANSTLPTYLLNMEIGDDTLYLENLTLNRHAIITSANYMKAGQAYNPYYEYGNKSIGTFTDYYLGINYASSNYVFSNNQPLAILTGATAKLHHGVGNLIDNGILGNYTAYPHTNFYVCNLTVQDWKDLKRSAPAFPAEKVDDLSFNEVTVFPNPFENSLRVTVPIDLELALSYKLISVNGSTVLEGEIEKGTLQKDINIPLMLPEGMDVLSVQSPEVSQLFKVIKNR